MEIVWDMKRIAKVHISCGALLWYVVFWLSPCRTPNNLFKYQPLNDIEKNSMFHSLSSIYQQQYPITRLFQTWVKVQQVEGMQ